MMHEALLNDVVLSKRYLAFPVHILSFLIVEGTSTTEIQRYSAGKLTSIVMLTILRSHSACQGPCLTSPQ